MAALPGVVIDTNVLVSALFAAGSTPGRAMTKAQTIAQLLASEATLAELDEVLHRPRFAKWLSLETRREFLRRYRSVVRLVGIESALKVCRDPKDDKFLDLAVAGQAAWVITGDDDLRALDPFREIRILRPQDFLEETANSPEPQ